MANPQLINYIRLQTKIGTSEADIRTGLAPGGWSEEDLKDAFEVVRTTDIPAVPKMPVKGEVNEDIVEKQTVVAVQPRKNSIVTELLYTSSFYGLSVGSLFLAVFALSLTVPKGFGVLPLLQDGEIGVTAGWLLYPAGVALILCVLTWIIAKRMYIYSGSSIHALLFAQSVYILLAPLFFFGTSFGLQLVVAAQYGKDMVDPVMAIFNFLRYPAMEIMFVGFICMTLLSAIALRKYNYPAQIYSVSFFVRCLCILIATFIMLDVTHTFSVLQYL
ncbi:MAG: hypothetical protein WAX38_01495 [Minisyncoccia bacterium]